MNIPLSVLVQALEALEAVNDYDVHNMLPKDLWMKVLLARSALGANVRPLLLATNVEVEA
jgi:hypothetical protein